MPRNRGVLPRASDVVSAISPEDRVDAVCDLVERGLGVSRPEEALLSISPHHPLQEACLWYVLHPLASVRGEAAGDQSREHAALALVAELPGYGDKVVNRALCALCDGEIAVQRPDAASAAAGAPADAPEPVPTAAQAALARADLVAEFRAARALAFALRRHAVAEEEQRSLQAAMAVERDACPPPRRRMTAGEEAEEAAAARARAVSRARVQLTHVAACDGDAASLLWRCVGADGLPAAPTHGGTSSRHAADDTGADAAISTLRRRRRASLQRHFGRSLSAAARAVQASMRLVQRAGAAGSRPSGAECDCLAAALSGATDDAVYQVHMREQLTATPRRLATAGAWARRFARWPTDDARTGSGRVAWVHAARFAALSAAAASGRDPVLASALTAPVVAAGIAERLQRLARREGGGTGEVQGTGAEMAVLVESCAAAVATPGTDGGAALWGAFVAHGLVAELAARVEQRPWCPVGTAFALCASLCVQRAPGRVGPEHARVVGCAVATSLALCARGDEEEEEEPVVARARLLRTWALTQIIHAHPAAATDVARPLRRAEVWTAVARRLGTASAPLRSQAFAELSLASEMASAGLGPPPEARVAEAQSSAAAREEQAPGPAAAQGSGWAGLLPAAAATALTSLTRPSSSPSAAALPVVCRVEVGPGLSLSCRPRRDAARLVASVSSQLECPGLHEVAALMSCLGALNEWDRSAVAHARPAQGGGEEGCGAVGREGGHEADKGGEEEEEEERKEEEDEGQDTFQRSMQQLLDPTLLTTGPERLDMGSERTPRPLSHGSGAPSGLEAVPEGGEGGEEEGVWTASVSPPLPAGGAEEHEVMDPLFSYRLVSLPVSGFCEALRGVRCQLRFAAGRAALLGQLPQPASALEAYGGVRAGTTVGGLALPLALRTCLHAVAAAAAHLRRGRPLPASLQSPRPGTAGSDGLDPGMDAWAILAEGCGTVGEALRRSLWLRVRLGSSPAVTGLMRELLAVACGEGAHGAGERSGVARRAAQVEAARCVGAFARACRGNQDTLVAASVVGLLGGLLHSEAARVRAAACDAVADVAEGNRAAAADVRAAGGLARLVETVDTGDLRPDGPSSRACATQTCLLRWDPATREELSRCGGLGVLAAQACALPLTHREVGRAADALRGLRTAPPAHERDMNGSVTAAAALSQALKGSSGVLSHLRAEGGVPAFAVLLARGPEHAHSICAAALSQLLSARKGAERDEKEALAQRWHVVALAATALGDRWHAARAAAKKGAAVAPAQRAAVDRRFLACSPFLRLIRQLVDRSAQHQRAWRACGGIEFVSMALREALAPPPVRSLVVSLAGAMHTHDPESWAVAVREEVPDALFELCSEAIDTASGQEAAEAAARYRWGDKPSIAVL